MLKIVEHNVETGEIIEREMTDLEYNQFLIDKELAGKKQEGIKDRETKKALLLEKLGLTAEEAQIVLS
jgi:hypothetical protein